MVRLFDLRTFTVSQNAERVQRLFAHHLAGQFKFAADNKFADVCTVALSLFTAITLSLATMVVFLLYCSCNATVSFCQEVCSEVHLCLVHGVCLCEYF